ncbi:MAG: tandem-95 repeat protein, partial [Bacteroidia bacterium]|nr:tandem-95 repeat protein [Bacteroidia bacterium]
SNGTLSLSADGSYTYTPNAGYTGLDSFVYMVCDTAFPANCDQATVYISVESMPDLVSNNAIIANNDHYIITKDSTISNTVLGNDYDPDGDAMTVNTTPLVDVANGSLTLNANGTFTYTPNTGFTGNDIFVYQVCDNSTSSICVTATVVIEVLSKEEICNCPPVALDDFVITEGGIPVSGELTTNDYDLDSDTITLNTTPISAPSNGSIAINTDGTYTYTPNSGFVGTDQMVYEISDTSTPQLSAQATLYIVVSSTVRDYSDLPSSWPEVYTRYADSVDVAAGASSYWLGEKISNEATINQNATATADAYDDGFIYPTVLDSTLTNLHQVIINGNEPGIEVFVKLFIDWNSDGTFDSTYVGSGITGSTDTVDLLVNVANNFAGGTVSYRVVAQTDSSLLDNSVLIGGEIEDYQSALPIPLPVEMLSFTARNTQNGTVTLDWETASEIDNHYFNVEHSTNGEDFIYIGTVEGNGNSQELNSYRFVHENPQFGVNYYRLKQVDFNGEFEYSSVLAVSKENKGAILYPNPVISTLNVQFEADNRSDMMYELIDPAGKVIKTEQLMESNQIDMTDVRKSVYLLNIYQKDILISSTRIVKI